MMESRRLTLEQLRDAGACEHPTDRFEYLFGSGADVTPDLCRKHSDEFNWNWAGNVLLSETSRRAFWAAACVHARLHFNRVKDAMSLVSGSAEERRMARLRAEAESMKIYNRETASEWGRLYVIDGQSSAVSETEPVAASS